jgi:hypothetical protein
LTDDVAQKQKRGEAVEICSQTDARLIWTFVKRGLVGLVLSREIDDLVVARSEVDVAHHSAAARAFAFDMQCEGGTLPLPAQDGAQTKARIDVADGDLHPRNTRVGAVSLAYLIFRIRTDQREVVCTEDWRRCKRRERNNTQHSGCNWHLVSTAR